MSRRNRERRDAFGLVENEERSSIEEAADAVYGASELSTGRVVAKPVDIMSIWPDKAQPRKPIPEIVMGRWDGDPATAIDVLSIWQLTVEQKLGQSVDVPGILKGRTTIPKAKNENGDDIPFAAIVENFLSLLDLASSIQHKGLTNPITISNRGSMYMIETGERRWWAHQLLRHFIGDKFGKILAREVEFDIWRQASENNNRDGLNVISKARQYALLLMDLYPEERFENIDTYVLPGECSRKYYAQAAKLRMKRGEGDRVYQHMGVGKDMCLNYQSLLQLFDYDSVPEGVDYRAINDEIWLKADSENWSYRAIIAEKERLFEEWFPPQKEEDKSNAFGLSQESSTGNTTNKGNSGGSLASTSETPPSNPTTAQSDSTSLPEAQGGEQATPEREEWPADAWVNTWAYVGKEKVWVHHAVKEQTVHVIFSTGDEQDIHLDMLQANPPELSEDEVLEKFQVGMRVRLTRNYAEHPKGRIGVVSQLSGEKGVMFEGQRFITIRMKGEQNVHVLMACEVVGSSQSWSGGSSATGGQSSSSTTEGDDDSNTEETGESTETGSNEEDAYSNLLTEKEVELIRLVQKVGHQAREGQLILKLNTLLNLKKEGITEEAFQGYSIVAADILRSVLKRFEKMLGEIYQRNGGE